MEQKPRKKRAERDPEKLARIMKDHNTNDIYTDVLGSYTGTRQDGGEPEQDADDL